MTHETKKNNLDAEYQKLQANYKNTVRKKSLFIIGGLLLFVSIIVATVVAVFKKSDALIVAEKYISANAEVQKETGGIKDFGMIPTGSLQISNGHGSANFTIDVNGKKHDLDVFVYLEKEPDEEWRVLEMRIEK